jgi:uncharacterized protein (DUF1015 family)
LARIFPFQAYRYSPSAGDIGHLITQPYDKISPSMRSRYLSLSPYNLVRIILGERRDGDNESDNVYTRAAAYFQDWIAKGVLLQDDSPGFYVYFQDFTVEDTGERLTRKGVIGLGAVEDYSAQVVHRHEQTLSGPKKDRLEVLKHTCAHFGQIFMLYPDPERAIDRILDEVARGNPDVDVTDEYGARHRLWRVSALARIEEIQRLMADKKLLIADGHHRYETALNFRNANPGLGDAGKVMMTFVNMYSDGLKILATHRVLRNLNGFDFRRFLETARGSFDVREFETAEQLRHALDQIDAGKVRIGVLPSTGGFFLLEAPRETGAIDVRILHENILGRMLGISEEAVRDERHISYVRGFDPAIAAVNDGDAQVAFLLQPTPIQQVADVAFSGGVMPQKSTDFYPKLLTGLTIYKLER